MSAIELDRSLLDARFRGHDDPGARSIDDLGDVRHDQPLDVEAFLDVAEADQHVHDVLDMPARHRVGRLRVIPLAPSSEMVLPLSSATLRILAFDTRA